jgi:NTE family protein
MQLMNSIGVVLSGGGVRGFAHLGLLKVLDEIGIKPSVISGVSAGAIFGALYASGKTPDEIVSLAKANKFLGIANLLWRREGLFSMQMIKKILLEQLPEDSFEALKIPLFINATDFLHIKTIFFSSGSLILPIIASSSVPVLFEPVSYENSKLVDGGLLNNFPIEPLVGNCEKIIGSHVNKLENISDPNVRLSKAAMIERCFHLSVANSVYSKVHMCNVFIEPRLDNFGLFRMKNIDQIYEIGYQTALKEKSKLAELLQPS